MKRRNLFIAAAVAACVAGGAFAQGAYPNRPIKLVVPFPPGGGVDLIGRLVAQKLGERLGQSVVVDNRGGASSILGTDIVAKSPADGYTLLMTSTAITANQSLFKKVPYDVAKDFVPIGLVANSPAILAVNPSVPASNLRDFIAHAKSRPGSIPYASYGNGSAPHLAGELFQQATGTKFLHVPYKGGGPALMATVGGETSLIIPSVVPVLSQLKDGKLRALGVASRQRHPLLPNVPTLREQGVSLETGTWFGVLAPAGTPAPVVSKLSAELGAILKDKDVQQKLIAEGAEPLSGSPEEFASFMAAEVRRWREVVTKAGIQPD